MVQISNPRTVTNGLAVRMVALYPSQELKDKEENINLKGIFLCPLRVLMGLGFLNEH
jgi:hypothetical protein